MRNYKCDAMVIGQRLKDARLSSKKGMTQLGFAEEIGVCVSNISKTEQGLRLPTIDLLFEYMNYFDKEANELLGSYGDGISKDIDDACRKIAKVSNVGGAIYSVDDGRLTFRFKEVCRGNKSR
ncbi:MAG: helix-turn-helix transcriptional regulator [Lachnospiraceae bacterium]|nr:helix-turn-helix transcriptional regulator [Lachnospiraceae bacterium]